MLKLCHHRQVFFSLILLLAVGVFAPGVASAQDATIAGTVTDTTGGFLPGVTVDARDAAGRSQVTVTDGTGQFTFSGLAPGTYAVTFTLSGFTAPAQVVEVRGGALLHESSRARTMPTDRILTGRFGMTLVGRARSSD